MLDGYGGNQCKQNEDSKSKCFHLNIRPLNWNLDADCGSVLKATNEWQYIESPGYEDGAYSEDQKCSWIIQASIGKRIQVKFVDFGFLCTTRYSFKFSHT